jgi:hypothetical protein
VANEKTQTFLHLGRSFLGGRNHNHGALERLTQIGQQKGREGVAATINSHALGGVFERAGEPIKGSAFHESGPEAFWLR